MQYTYAYLPPAYAAEVMFSSCLCFCVCVCVLSVRAIPFEAVGIETSFLVWWYILTISKSSLGIKGHWVKVKVISWKMLILLLDISLNMI